MYTWTRIARWGADFKIGESVPLHKVYTPKTLHGYCKVKSKQIINMLNYDLTFFEINELVEYDMILGEPVFRIKVK